MHIFLVRIEMNAGMVESRLSMIGSTGKLSLKLKTTTHVVIYSLTIAGQAVLK